MFVGINRRYLCHVFRHTIVNKFLILLAVPGLISLYPSTISIMSARKAGLANYVSEEEYRQERIVRAVLKRATSENEEEINRLSKIIVRHSRNKNLDPKLVAAIVVVESSGNPLAISGAKSIGLMQIHLPTWSQVVDFTTKNPFDPEVNIEIGTAILSDYLKNYKDLRSALAAYEGSGNPDGSDYPNKILEIYQSRLTLPR
jgi:soluble lytic murein transglycosylase-like protein